MSDSESLKFLNYVMKVAIHHPSKQGTRNEKTRIGILAVDKHEL